MWRNHFDLGILYIIFKNKIDVQSLRRLYYQWHTEDVIFLNSCRDVTKMTSSTQNQFFLIFC